MEPFETRFARLTPEQKQEVEDFVDFLLQKNGSRQPVGPLLPLPVLMNAPPVMVPEVLPVPEPVPERPVIIPPDPIIHAEESPSVIHEIAAGGDDWITRDYMDYGAFEKKPSPATGAVAKVKKNVITRRAAAEKPHHLLDWVD